MATIQGDFVDARGDPCSFDGVPIEITRDGQRLHIRMEGSGRGSVTVKGSAGAGEFTALGGKTFRVDVRLSGANGLDYELRDGENRVAGGTILNLPT